MEFQFEETKDAELIRSVVTHPRVFKHLFDDDLPDPATWNPIEFGGVVYVVVKAEGKVIGLFIINAHNRIAWELHEGFLPEAIRAGYPLPAAVAFREWIWSNSECQRLFGWIVKSNRLALKFAKAAGMKVCGINERSFMKNGVVQDQLLVGISRPEGR